MIPLAMYRCNSWLKYYVVKVVVHMMIQLLSPTDDSSVLILFTCLMHCSRTILYCITSVYVQLQLTKVVIGHV